MRAVTRILLLLAALLRPAAAEEPFLVFQQAGKEIARFTAAELAAQVAPRAVSFFDPHHDKKKSYRCFPLRAVMNAAYGSGWLDSVHTEAVLSASDGYASVTKAAKLAEDGGCLAFEDLDVAGWEPIGRKQANPGPFYVIWTGEAQSAANEYPWPWQLVSVNLVEFKERYPEIVAKGAAKGSPAELGSRVFRGQCLRCHAINRQGGKIGPDLNAPRSIVSYRSKKILKEYIRKPSAFRHTEMPDHPHLTDADLENLYQYFKLKATQPEKKTW